MLFLVIPSIDISINELILSKIYYKQYNDISKY